MLWLHQSLTVVRAYHKWLKLANLHIFNIGMILLCGFFLVLPMVLAAQKDQLLVKGPINMDEILTVQEVADYFKVSRSTVWRWCNQGKLLAFKAGHGWRVHRSELEKIIANNPKERDEVKKVTGFAWHD